MILCMRCGRKNNPDQNYCFNCGATLPKLAYTMEMAAVEKINDLYYKFKDACDMVKSEQMSIDEFEDYVLKMQETLDKNEEAIRNVDLGDDIIGDFEEELEIGFNGVDCINDGTEKFLDFVEDENPAHLENGLQLILKGLELIHKARTINRERDRRLSVDADVYRSQQSMEL